MPIVGQRVLDYLLDAHLGGHGAAGDVWRARHHVWLDQRVTIRFQPDQQWVNHGLIHPNIARLIAIDLHGDPPFLVMEHVPGTSLRELVQQGPILVDDAVAILRQILTGLSYAHRQGVVHGDLRLENILVHERAARDGYSVADMVKMTDFGVRRVAADDSVHPRADLRACGAVLYELMTGQPLAVTKLPSEVNLRVPTHLDDAIHIASADGFANADEFAVALTADSVTTAAANCPRCNRAVASNDQFCMHCGIQLLTVVRRCAKCSAYPHANDRYCMFCGEELRQVLSAECRADSTQP